MANTISVIIPTYNRASYIADTLGSVLNQTFKNIEVVVVDDGSTDSTKAVIDTFSDPRVKYFWKENGGLSSARNYGIKKSQSRIVAFLDSDDLWETKKLEKQLFLMEQFFFDLVYTDFQILLEDGTLKKSQVTYPLPTGNMHELLCTGNFISGSGSAVLIKKECFEAVGFFDENLRAFEDLDMWRRLARHGFRFGKVEEELVFIRQHSAQMQKNNNFMIVEGSKYCSKLISDDYEKSKTFISNFIQESFGFYISQSNNFLYVSKINYAAAKMKSHSFLFEREIEEVKNIFIKKHFLRILFLALYPFIMPTGILFFYRYLKSTFRRLSESDGS